MNIEKQISELHERHHRLLNIHAAIVPVWDEVAAHYQPIVNEATSRLIADCNQPVLAGRIQAMKEFISLPERIRKHISDLERELSGNPDSQGHNPLFEE